MDEISTSDHSSIDAQVRAKIYPFDYDMSWQDLTRAVGKPFAYAVLSLGALFPFFQCAITRILLSHTRFYGVPFEYVGSPRDLLWGYLARMGFAISGVSLVYFTGKVDGTLQLLVAAIFLAMFIVLIPVSLLASSAYRINHTAWGGSPFQLDVSRRVFVARFLHGMGLTCLTLGVGFPYFISEIYKTIWGGFRVGPLQTMYSGHLKHLFKLHLGFLIFFVPTLGLNSFWYVAKVIRYLANASWLGSRELGAARGFSDLRGEDLLGLALLNLLSLVGSAGLALPWVMHHTYAYLVQRVKFYGDINLSLVVQDPISQAEPAHATETVPEAV